MPSTLGNPNHGNQGQPYEDDAYSDRNHGKILPVPKTTERAFEREERRPCAFRPASPRAQEEHTCACDKPQFDDCEEPWRKSSIEIRQHGQGKHSVVHRQTLKKPPLQKDRGGRLQRSIFPQLLSRRFLQIIRQQSGSSHHPRRDSWRWPLAAEWTRSCWRAERPCSQTRRGAPCRLRPDHSA